MLVKKNKIIISIFFIAHLLCSCSKPKSSSDDFKTAESSPKFLLNYNELPNNKIQIETGVEKNNDKNGPLMLKHKDGTDFYCNSNLPDLDIINAVYKEKDDVLWINHGPKIPQDMKFIRKSGTKGSIYGTWKTEFNHYRGAPVEHYFFKYADVLDFHANGTVEFWRECRLEGIY